jgi:hypothetical protein
MFGGRLLRSARLGAAVTCAACAGNSTPKGWLPSPKEAQEAAYGGWIELTYLEAGQQQKGEGELIAVTADSVWVLTEYRGLVIPTSAVLKGKLTGYAAQNLTAWALAGTLSTLSNGAFLVFTMPMWIVGGSLAKGSESRAAERKSPPLEWAELASFARFPQGFPEGIELSGLSRRTARDRSER